jgi:hypothetical protein
VSAYTTGSSAIIINRSNVSANTTDSAINRTSEGDINQDRRIKERSYNKKASSAGVRHYGYYEENHRGN